MTDAPAARLSPKGIPIACFCTEKRYGNFILELDFKADHQSLECARVRFKSIRLKPVSLPKADCRPYTGPAPVLKANLIDAVHSRTM